MRVGSGKWLVLFVVCCLYDCGFWVEMEVEVRVADLVKSIKCPMMAGVPDLSFGHFFPWMCFRAVRLLNRVYQLRSMSRVTIFYSTLK